ncbi:anion transporter [Marinobacter sp. ELB17]|nr:anion transporter [Marinobacter sp. ELB17]
MIGTPPNALLAAYLLDAQGIEVGFAQWMLLGLPVAVVMLLLVWWWLIRVDFGIGRADDSGEMIRRELEALGPLGRGEKRVGLVFVLTASAWIFRPLLTANLAPRLVMSR